MGIDYYVCQACHEPFPDCGYYAHCEHEHMIGPCCAPREHRWEWPKSMMRDDIPDYGWVVKEEHCPVCKAGGPIEQQLEAANGRIAELEAMLKRYRDGVFGTLAKIDTGDINTPKWGMLVNGSTATIICANTMEPVGTLIRRGYAEYFFRDATESHTLREQVAKLKVALGFYADEANWRDVDTGIGPISGPAVDYGATAREALVNSVVLPVPASGTTTMATKQSNDV
jgi:hypothetical protein